MSEKKTYICDACKSELTPSDQQLSRERMTNFNGVEVRFMVVDKCRPSTQDDLCEDCWCAMFEMSFQQLKEPKKCSYP